MDLLRFIEETQHAQTSKHLFSILEKALLSYGYDRLLFSLMNNHPTLDKKAGHGLMLNYPAGWVEHYNERKYEDIDPVRSHVSKALTPFTWKELEDKKPLTNLQKKCLLEAKDAGLKNGIAIAMRGPFGELAGLGAASSNTQFTNPNDLAMINAICQHFYARYTHIESQSSEGSSKTIVLTPRETEVLSWCAHGKTTWEISKILGISENGVLFHLKNIMTKFNTSSRVHAVIQAFQLNLIQI